MSNENRRYLAQQAIYDFQRREPTDDCDAVTDLLTNLMHLCADNAARWGTFEAALRKARSHFDAEHPESAPACEGSPVPEDPESDGEHAFNANGVCIECGVKDKRG